MPYDFTQLSPPIAQQAGSWLTTHKWVFIVGAALLALFIAHRLLWTRYGTDPRWKLTSQEDQMLEYEKQEHPLLEEDEHLPTDHWGI